MLGFLVAVVLIPLLVNEAGDLVPSLARCLLRWGARHIGQADQAERYEEEWLADLDRIPGKLTKLAHACGVLVRSVPCLRAQFRPQARWARLFGVLAGRSTGRPGRRLCATQEIDATLQHVAVLLVPQFADHCFIDLLHGGVLIRSVQRHAGGWAPPAGTWAQVGEQIRYPRGHFCQQAMECLDTVLVANLAKEDRPAPSARSAATTQEVGLTSVISAPLYARGVLLGVISVARSRLTSRDEPYYSPADRDLFGAIAGWVSAAVDNANPSGAKPLAALATCIPQPEHHQRAFPAVEPPTRRSPSAARQATVPLA
jgi:hypothetical protein